MKRIGPRGGKAPPPRPPFVLPRLSCSGRERRNAAYLRIEAWNIEKATNPRDQPRLGFRAADILRLKELFFGFYSARENEAQFLCDGRSVVHQRRQPGLRDGVSADE